MGVGDLIGKLFGGDAAKNEALLRAYGKLPFYAEYRRLELAPGTATAYSQWLDAGRLTWVRSPTKSENGVTRASRLVLTLPDAPKEIVIGNIWDSRDTVGRVFPFSFFTVCPIDALGSTALERWVSISDMHRSFDRLYTQLHSLGAGGDFYKVFQKRTLPVRPEECADRAAGLVQDAEKITVEAWSDGVQLADETKPPAWFHGMDCRIKRWREKPELLAEKAVSLPLAGGIPVNAQIAVWLEWFSAAAQTIDRTPWLVIPSGDQPGGPVFHLGFRDLLEDDYQLITTDEGSYGYADNLNGVVKTDLEAMPSDVTLPEGTLAGWLKERPLIAEPEKAE